MTRTGLDGVTVVYRDGSVALDRVGVLADAGEILAVIGPSGSGKSTLLRAVAGLVPVRGGEVLIGGRRVTQLPADQRRVAMVFESSAVFPFLDVSRNLGWGLEIRRTPDPEIRSRVRAQARGLRLGRLLARMPKTLSAGELARVGIGHALVHEPSAFLFDEPLAHLDAAERRSVRRRILQVVRSHPVSTLYVTHDQEEALAIGDRVVLLDRGTVVQIDSPQVLYDRPVNAFAAGFVGSPAIGFLPATLVESGSGADGWTGTDDGSGSFSGFRVGARTLPLWGPLPPALAASRQRAVVLGIRPADVHDARAGSDPSAVTLPATVVHVEETGADVVVTLEVAAGAADLPGAPADETGPDGRARLRSRFSRDAPVRPGESVPIAVDVTRAHVFDPLTGRALHHPAGR